MRLIDFDAQYAKYAENWIRENAKNYKNMDQMEASLPEMYLRWLNAPADWLNGRTPGTYFSQFEDVGELVDGFVQYGRSDTPMPDQLLEAIVERGAEAVGPLLNVAEDEDMPRALRMTALNMMIELEATEPLPLCLELVLYREMEDELADVAAEVLEAIGHPAVKPLLDRLDEASDAALLTMLDLLCNFPGDERIYEYAVRQFMEKPEQRALYATYLGKLGDHRAIEPLKAMALSQELNYLDYLEIKNAIEALGGEYDGPEREFSGDPYYESMKKME